VPVPDDVVQVEVLLLQAWQVHNPGSSTKRSTAWHSTDQHGTACISLSTAVCNGCGDVGMMCLVSALVLVASCHTQMGFSTTLPPPHTLKGECTLHRGVNSSQDSCVC
jgi:hypothetical protein